MTGEHSQQPGHLATEQVVPLTTGPWDIDTEWTYSDIHPNWVAIRIGDTGLTVSGHIGIANGRLIAAAPRMYSYLSERAASGDSEAATILESIHAGR
jgi:hypothetical protein